MEPLDALRREALACTRCRALAETRTQVVFGSGPAAAQLMLVGEAPGRAEDELGTPFTGAAGDLLDELLAAIGLARADVFITYALMCRPPGNRHPLPQEVANCQGWLHRQLELVRPRLVCTLGNFATRALREDPTPVTQLHGRAEVRTVGPLALRLLPLYHPAAALYTRALLETLREDVARIPELLALPAPEQPEAPPPAVQPVPEPDEPDDAQLGLF